MPLTSFCGESSRPGEPALAGRRILVTAGPTWVPIDGIRHVASFATGSLGRSLARAATRLGMETTLLLGPGRCQADRRDRRSMRVLDFVTFDDLHALVRSELGAGEYDVMVHTAAVADYRPAGVPDEKTPSGRPEWVLRLVPTPKIVDEVRSLAPGIVLVKFKLELGRTDRELERIAAASRERSDADLIVANDRARLTRTAHPAILMDRSGVIARTSTRARLSAALFAAMASCLDARAGHREAVA